MTNKIYEEYAVLTAQIKVLTDKKAELNSQILEELVGEDVKGIDTPVGKFTISKLKTWTYTAQVKEMEENFKAIKAIEESTGEATYEEKPSLRFTPVKF